jgi:DNA replication initiation complex subunit (GINS family)
LENISNQKNNQKYMTELEKNFYREVQSNIRDFAKYSIEEIEGKKEIEYSQVQDEINRIRQIGLTKENLIDIRRVIEDAIEGAIHSIFVSIDGGTALSDNGKALELINRTTGKPLTEGALHENFMEVFD